MPSCFTSDSDDATRESSKIKTGARRAAYAVTGMRRFAPAKSGGSSLPSLLKESCTKMWKRVRGGRKTSAVDTPPKTVITTSIAETAPGSASLSSADDTDDADDAAYNRSITPTPLPTLAKLNIADSALDLPALAPPEVRAPTDPPKTAPALLTSTRQIPDPDGFRPSIRNRRLSTDPAMRFREIAAEWKSMAPVDGLSRRDSTIRLVQASDCEPAHLT